jgi:catechol 2,3-dioxygenase-like lactoylglutathione lyase family enzyme
MRIFRLTLHVGDAEEATTFYARLLGVPGRAVGGGRVYFDCGGLILALLTPDEPPLPLAEYVYFAVDDLEAAHARAAELQALAAGEVHGASAGAIAVRPWGERSFYASDPWGNGLCFVDDKTLFTGRR